MVCDNRFSNFSSLNYFATCVEQPVLRECGSPAWTVIARVLHDTTKTLMPSCKFDVPVPEQSIAAADGVVGTRPSNQQSNSSKAAGRPKTSSIGTMTANPAGRESKTKGGKSNAGRSSSLNSKPVGGAGWDRMVWSNLLLAVMASMLGFMWLGGRNLSLV